MPYKGATLTSLKQIEPNPELEHQAFAESRREAAGALGRHWDTNGDGVIDNTESAAAVEELKARAASRLSELFLAAAGGDEVLDMGEFTALAPDPNAVH